MSTTIETGETGKYVDFDEYIDYQLGKTRHSIKWTDIFTTLAAVSALVLGYLLVFTLFDHWVVDGGFSPAARGGMLAFIILAALGIVVWKIVLPWWKNVSALYAARMLEQSAPEFKSTLLNLVDLRRSGREIPPAILKTLEKRSAMQLAEMDVDHAVDRTALLRLSYLLLGIVTLSCIYALMSPKPISFFRPFTTANVPVATQTEIFDVQPGDAEVLIRERVDVRVMVRGKPADQVLFHYTTADRTFVDETLVMSAVDDNPGEYRVQFAGEQGEGVTQTTRYHITAGDARTDDFTLTVISAPSATVQRVDYEYPDYMQLEPRSQAVAAVDAWEGTSVTVHAESTIPVESAVLELFDEEGEGRPQQFPVTVTDGRKLSVTWALAFRDDGTYPRKYRIVCRSADGHVDPAPSEYPVTIRPDLPPEVALLDPQGDITRPANAVVPLLYKARDPDFQLAYLTLRVEQGGRELTSVPLFEGEQQVVLGQYRWELAPLGLKPGSVVEFSIEARDNKQPFGNRKRTPPLKLTIAEQASEEQVEEQTQQDEERQEEIRKQEEESAEADAESGADAGGAGGSDAASDSEEGETPNETGEKSESGESETGSEAGGKGDEPKTGAGDRNQDEAPKEGGQAGDQPGAQETGEPPSPESDTAQPGGNQPLNDDGTDDAEALEKVIQNQQQEGRPQPESGSPPDPGEDAGNPPDENQNPQQQADAPQSDPKGSDDASGGGTSPDKPSGNERPGENASGKPGEGETDPRDPTRDGPGNKPSDSESTPDKRGPGEPGQPGKTQPDDKPSDDPGARPPQPGDPDTKGTGRPSDAPMDDATPARDPNNIQREPGTKPSTRPGETPDKPNAPQENPGPRPDNPPQPGERRPGDNRKPPGQNDQPSGAEQPNPGEGRPDGQKARRPDAGEEGSSQQQDEGNPGQAGKGNGDPSGKPGDSEANPDGRPGQPSDKPGEGSSTEPAESGTSPSGQGGKEEGGAGAGGAEGESSQEQKGGSSGSSGKPGRGGSEGPSAPGGGGEAGGELGGAETAAQREQQNLDHAKQAADLVLKQLEQDLRRGDVDPDLLKELGWTEEQMRQFADRLRRNLARESGALTGEDRVKQRQFEEMLKNVDFQPTADARRGSELPSEKTRSFGSHETPVPLKFRDYYEAVNRELSRKKSGR